MACMSDWSFWKSGLGWIRVAAGAGGAVLPPTPTLVPTAPLLAPGLPLPLLTPAVPPPFWATGAAAELVLWATGAAAELVPTVLTGAVAEFGLRSAEGAEVVGMAVMGML